jgi:hypothetical protein
MKHRLLAFEIDNCELLEPYERPIDKCTRLFVGAILVQGLVNQWYSAGIPRFPTIEAKMIEVRQLLPSYDLSMHPAVRGELHLDPLPLFSELNHGRRPIVDATIIERIRLNCATVAALDKLPASEFHHR